MVRGKSKIIANIIARDRLSFGNLIEPRRHNNIQTVPLNYLGFGGYGVISTSRYSGRTRNLVLCLPIEDKVDIYVMNNHSIIKAGTRSAISRMKKVVPEIFGNVQIELEDFFDQKTCDGMANSMIAPFREYTTQTNEAA